MVNKRLQSAKNVLNVPWALSGSMAMKLYGNKARVPTRNAGNVNVVVTKNNMARAYNNLFSLVPRNIPRNTSHVKSRNHYNLHPYDLLRANSNLAPSINAYVEINGIPVVPVNKLLKYKNKTLQNFPTNAQKVKILSNIEKLREIISKLPALELKHRVLKQKTPERTRGLTRSRLTFNSPPSSPKRLF
jgi:hypothetical protein